MAQHPARRPHPAALAAAGMVVAALLAASVARVGGYSPVQSLGTAEVAQSRLLRFESDAQGVAVIDATTGTIITHTSGEGFIPGVLRGLNRMRQTEQASTADAYRLEHLSNGRLLLVDTASGVSLDLAAYGRDNAASFLRFLSPSGDQG
ncbi:photosynthetic complex assembly protein PuhC [Aestuariivirga litoralis]|nr:photosynthetic complex assembly protein PuhC [Aestuariivirga litoralis]